jgi:hypothetical protein
MKKALLVVAFGIVIVAGCILLFSARAPDTAHAGDMPIGMNLTAVTYWTRELPFVDVAKSSMPWVTQNVQDVPGAVNPWDSGVIGSIRLTATATPSLPVDVKGTEAPQAVATLMCRDLDGHYPGGRYVCLYEGRGEIRFGLDARAVRNDPGRIELDVTPTSRGILMKVIRSEKNDRVRNIRVIMPGFEATHAAKPFNPLYLERLRPFRAIRFMDWGRTNDSPVRTWAQRTRTTFHTQAGRNGVALEHMIELCNALNADAWLCLPHQADADYVRQCAGLVRGRLSPSLKIYVEYSNEVWNRTFEQYRWVDRNGEPGLSQARKYAGFARQAFEAWDSGFGGRDTRVIRVVSGQQANPVVMEDIMGHLRASTVDAMAVSAYFGLGPGGHDSLKALGIHATAHDVMACASDNMRLHEIPPLKRHAALAARHRLRLLIYEGGQSLCPSPMGSSPAYLKALWEAQRSPEMYAAYREFFALLRPMSPGVFMAFSFVTPQETRYGSWGHLEYLDQDVRHAPKYRALLEETGPRH